MKIEVLREFTVITETLSFSAAAKRLFLSHSVLSRHITALEDELGVKLFLRTSHFVQLTPEGEKFRAFARTIIDDHDKALESMREAQAAANRRLRVGFLPEGTRQFIASGSKEFLESHPENELVFHALEVHAIFEAIENDDIDVGICFILKGFEGKEWNNETLFSDRFEALVPKGSTLARKDYLTPDDLRNHTIILLDLEALSKIGAPPDNIRSFFERAGLGKNLSETLTDAPSLALDILTKDKTISIQPRHMQHFFGPAFAFVPIKGFNEPLRMIALWKRAKESEPIKSYAFCLGKACSQLSF